MITYQCFKAVRSDGKSFYNAGEIDYLAHIGEWVEVSAAPAREGQCARGIHVSPSARHAAVASSGLNPETKNFRPWRFVELSVEHGDVVWPPRANEELLRNTEKWRVRRALVVREVSFEEALGCTVESMVGRFKGRAQAIRTEAATWRDIAWLKPTRTVSDEEVVALMNQWRERVAPYVAKGKALPVEVRVVRDRAAAAADAADASRLIWRFWWYCRPYYALRRHARWMFNGLPEEQNPYKPLVELYRLGCVPIGYANGAFVVYAPKAVAGAGEVAA